MEPLTEDSFVEIAERLGGPVLLAYLAPDPPGGHAVAIDWTSPSDVVRDRLGKWWKLDVDPVLAVAAFGAPEDRAVIYSGYIHGVPGGAKDDTVLDVCWGRNAEGLMGRHIDREISFQAPHGHKPGARRGRYLYLPSGVHLVPS